MTEELSWRWIAWSLPSYPFSSSPALPWPDNDKMFRLQGSKESVLIDSGMGRGNLAAYVAKFTGSRPLAVIFTHDHGDHIGQADQFVRHSVEYIGAQDRQGLVQFLRSRGISPAAIAAHVVSVHDGEQIDVDNLQHAVQLLLDRGDAALVPSYRPPGLSQVIVGDRLHDPNWVAVNVNRDHYLPARIAHLLSGPPAPPR